jgi:cytochrome oxidase assembly protein ShyY1
VYRFLLQPRWIGLGLLMALAAATMVGLGFWQLDRFHTRTDVNNRIDNASNRPAVPIADALTPPSPVKPGIVGPAPTGETSWTMVTVTGQYDRTHEILARSRSVNSDVGFEVLTPLVLGDGTAVLVDRGWIAPTEQGAAAVPTVPAPPAGPVTVVGRVHAPESRADLAEPFGNVMSVRHIAPQQLTSAIPLPLYGAYVTLETQTPPADPAFTPIPPEHQDAAMNAGYTAQWWLFAVLTLFGFGYLARREAHPTEDRPRRMDIYETLERDLDPDSAQLSHTELTAKLSS